MHNLHPYGSFSAEDLGKLRSMVLARSNAALTFDEVEDIVGEILVQAVEASAITGIPVVKLAFTAATRRPRYYTKAVESAMKLEADRHPTGDPDWVAEDNPETRTPFSLVDLLHAGRKLSLEERQVLLYVVAYDYTLAELSKASGIPVSTLHRRKVSAVSAFALAMGIDF